MAYQQRIGATGDSLRIKNDEWYIARSYDGSSDIRVFKVNTLDQVEFASVPNVDGDSFVLTSQFEELEERVAILEAIIFAINPGNINIINYVWTSGNISSKSFIAPQIPINSTAMIIPASGIPQLQGVDFVVSGNEISWDGMPYEAIAAEGDQVKIVYLF